MRALAILIGLLATLAGTYGGYAVMRAVGPDDRSGEFGYGDAALAPAGGGTLLQSRNFPLVIKALQRELGPDGGVNYLNLKLTEATATGRRGHDGRELSIRIDASGRSQVNELDSDSLSAQLPVSKLDPASIDTVIRAARKETGVPVETLTLQGSTREWRADMLRGEPDAFIANLDGSGLRLSGEPNPIPQGAAEDSMFRARNLEQVLAKVAKEGDELTSLSVWPERVSASVAAGGREVSLDYAYGAQLTSRDVRPRSDPSAHTVKLSTIDPEAIERLARSVHVKGLKHVRYVLLNPVDVFQSTPSLSTYLPDKHQPPYIITDLHGRHVTWPGKRS